MNNSPHKLAHHATSPPPQASTPSNQNSDLVMQSTARILEAVGAMVTTLSKTQGNHMRKSKTSKSLSNNQSHRRTYHYDQLPDATEELETLLLDHRIWPPDVPLRRYRQQSIPFHIHSHSHSHSQEKPSIYGDQIQANGQNRTELATQISTVSANGSKPELVRRSLAAADSSQAIKGYEDNQEQGAELGIGLGCHDITQDALLAASAGHSHSHRHSHHALTPSSLSALILEEMQVVTEFVRTYLMHKKYRSMFHWSRH